MNETEKIKGVALFSFVIGLLVLFIGVALMYLLPDYIIGALNSTGIMSTGGCYATNTTPAQCTLTVASCCVRWNAEANATNNVNTLRSLGFVVIIIAVIWMVISIVAGGTGKGM